jgi:hypothetical protein
MVLFLTIEGIEFIREINFSAASWVVRNYIRSVIVESRKEIFIGSFPNYINRLGK